MYFFTLFLELWGWGVFTLLRWKLLEIFSRIKSYFTAWNKATNNDRNPKQKINQKNVIIRIAEISQVFFLNFFIRAYWSFSMSRLHFPSCHFSISLAQFKAVIYIFFHLYKVLGNKVLPLVCLIIIVAYWTSGVILPSSDNILDDNVSNCTPPE